MMTEAQQKLDYRQNAVPGTLFYRIGYNMQVSKVKVERVTKTLIQLEDGTRLSKKLGIALKEGYFLSQADYEPVLPFVTEQLAKEVAQREFLAEYSKRYQEILELLDYSHTKANTSQKRLDLLEIFYKFKEALEKV